MNIYTNGVYDLFHIGHLNILERAKSLGGTLTVGINTDEYTLAYKARRPIIPYKQRKRIVDTLKCVDKTIPHMAMDQTDMLDKYDIDVVVVDSEWGKLPEQKVRKEYIEKTGRKLVVFPYTEGISTTEIIERIRNQYAQKA